MAQDSCLLAETNGRFDSVLLPILAHKYTASVAAAAAKVRAKHLPAAPNAFAGGGVRAPLDEEPAHGRARLRANALVRGGLRIPGSVG